MTLDTPVGRVTPQIRVAWERENLSDDDTVGAQLLRSPFGRLQGGGPKSVGGVRMSGQAPDRQEDWLSLGAGVLLEVNDRMSLLLDYQENFREGCDERYIGVRASLRF